MDKQYYRNGQLQSKGNYKDNKHDGLWEQYYDNGLLHCKGNYKDGEKEERIYNENKKAKEKS